MPEPPRRPDLAAMIGPLGRALVAMELPVLEQHGLTMWGYSALLGLGDEPVYTQSALAKAIGADKTRLIAVLDELQRQGLIRREPDPADRRVNLVSITQEGRTRRERTQRDIQQQEERILATLPQSDRRAFLRALHTLSTSTAQQG
ncbi:MarR family winged helix-turn-helix transcriptional regulator [Nocardia callitridis]|uniref:MarR family transcriptional regulator n=1 Tax=Nocardia callitridis TaxID=648753 RepID=A0ABP9KUN3_9NOCA